MLKPVFVARDESLAQMTVDLAFLQHWKKDTTLIQVSENNGK